MCEGGFLRDHVRGGNLAQGELAFQQFERMALDLYEFPGRIDLPAQGRLLYGRGDHIRGQRQVSGFELEALVVGLRFERLDLPSRAAKHIERIGHSDLRGVQAVDVTVVGLPQRSASPKSLGASD